jgi:hypothetical protein
MIVRRKRKRKERFHTANEFVSSEEEKVAGNSRQDEQERWHIPKNHDSASGEDDGEKKQNSEKEECKGNH